MAIFDVCYSFSGLSFLVPLFFSRAPHRMRFAIVGSFFIKVALLAVDIVGRFQSPFSSLLGSYDLPWENPAVSAIVDIIFSACVFYLMYYTTLPRPRIFSPNNRIHISFEDIVESCIVDPLTIFYNPLE